MSEVIAIVKGFLLIDKKQKLKVALHIENEMRYAMKK